MDCKKFVKDIQTLDKEMWAWDTFTDGLDSTVKKMVTSLRAVRELSTSIRHGIDQEQTESL